MAADCAQYSLTPRKAASNPQFWRLAELQSDPPRWRRKTPNVLGLQVRSDDPCVRVESASELEQPFRRRNRHFDADEFAFVQASAVDFQQHAARANVDRVTGAHTGPLADSLAHHIESEWQTGVGASVLFVDHKHPCPSKKRQKHSPTTHCEGEQSLYQRGLGTRSPFYQSVTVPARRAYSRPVCVVVFPLLNLRLRSPKTFKNGNILVRRTAGKPGSDNKCIFVHSEALMLFCFTIECYMGFRERIPHLQSSTPAFRFCNMHLDFRSGIWSNGVDGERSRTTGRFSGPKFRSQQAASQMFRFFRARRVDIIIPFCWRCGL